MRVEPDLRRFARLSQRPNPGRGRVVFAKKKEKPVILLIPWWKAADL